jgi:predicted dehydrogenase
MFYVCKNAIAMIRIGIIGDDRNIVNHINIIKSIPEFEYKGFYYPNGANANINLRARKLNRFLSYKEFLDSVDAIDIASTQSTLYDTVISALKKSKHIYISPLLLKSYEQALKIIKLANEANITLMVQKTAKYNAALNSVIERLSDTRLIEIQHHAALNSNLSDTSLFSIIINNLDIIHTILRSNSKLIKVCGVSILNNKPDIINVRVEFDNGCVANISCSSMALKNNHKATFILKNEIIKINFHSNKTQLLSPEKDSYKNKGTYKLKAKSFKTPPNNTLYYEFINFRDTIINNSKSLSNLEDGFKSLLTAFKIFEKVHVI